MNPVVSNRMDSVQALRALAFLGIFLFHAEFWMNWPELGVSVFFVLSGFLLYINNCNVNLNTSHRACFRFSIHRVKKLYPLHILTMSCAIILSLISFVRDGVDVKGIVVLLAKIGLNITLLQTWIPYSNINTSLNGVAWFLSVTMFLYFTFPKLLKLIRKAKCGVALGLCLLCIFGGILLCIPMVYVLGSDSKIYGWFMYSFPIFRLTDFCVGCCVGRFFLFAKEKNFEIIIASLLEIFTLALTIIVLKIVANSDNFLLSAIFNRTSIYIPLAALWVFVFAMRKGIITIVLSNPLLIKLGNISQYLFLIHYVITQYCNYFLDSMDKPLDTHYRYMLIALELLVSILISCLYRRYEAKFLIIISKRYYKKIDC